MSSKKFIVTNGAYAAMATMLAAQFEPEGFFGSQPRFKGAFTDVEIEVSTAGPWGPQGFGIPNIDVMAYIQRDSATRQQKRDAFLEAAKKVDPAFTSGAVSEFFHWMSASCRPNGLNSEGVRLINGRAGGVRPHNVKVPSTTTAVNVTELTARIAELEAHNNELQAQLDAFVNPNGESTETAAAATLETAIDAAAAIIPDGEIQAAESTETPIEQTA